MGATGFDADYALALDPVSIRMEGDVLTDKNIHYDALKVKGPLSDPKIEMGAILARVFDRVADGLVNLGIGGLSAAVDIAKGGVEVVKVVGSGTLAIGKNIGKSVLAIGTGLVKLDEKELREGLVGATQNTAGLVAKSAQGTGAAAGGSVQRSVADLKGDARVQAWDAGIPTRHQAAMQQAQEALAKMLYPPVTD